MVYLSLPVIVPIDISQMPDILTKYSVLITIYKKNDPDQLEAALNSVLNQTIPPHEIVLVEDGPITDSLSAIITGFKIKVPDVLKCVTITRNIGISDALNEGLRHITNDLVGRMDGDDLALPDRFEKQLDFFERNPEYAIVGGQVEEFVDMPGDTGILRALPVSHDDLVKYSKKRCPFNHPTVMYRKSVIEAVGGYEDFKSPTEDYFLWCKIINSGYRVANLPDVLIHYRIGRDFIERRTGFNYMKGEYILFRKLREIRFLNTYEYIRNIVSRLPLRILPVFVTRLIYTKLLR